jgi:hypothetical protein
VRCRCEDEGPIERSQGGFTEGCVDVKYSVNVSVYVPSAAVWSIPFRRVLWFVFLNKLHLCQKNADLRETDHFGLLC